MTTSHILAGDIGGTKTQLALYRMTGPERALVREQIFPSRDFPSLEAVAQLFLAGERVDAAAFGIAGPVIDNAVRTTNLPWHVLPDQLSRVLACPRVRLLNDLGTTAIGALHLPAERFYTLQAGEPRPGNIGLIAAGTGLGQAFLYWDGRRHQPSATEGGHADFAPVTADDVRLLEWAQSQYGHVSWERFVSGPGLYVLYRFLTEQLGRPADAEVQDRLHLGEDPPAVVGTAAAAGSSATAREAVAWFVRLYGAQAGNLALTVMALGGLYIGGGVVTHMVPQLETFGFCDAFCAKGRYRDMMRAIPVRAILEPKTSLYGAVEAAVQLLEVP